MKLADFLANTKSLTVDFGAGRLLQLSYRPQGLPAQEAALASDDLKIEDIARQTSALLAGWDLTGDDDQPIPTTSQSLLSLPIGILGTVYQAIMKDITPGEATGSSSSAPSNGTASLEPSPTTTP